MEPNAITDATCAAAENAPPSAVVDVAAKDAEIMCAAAPNHTHTHQPARLFVCSAELRAQLATKDEKIDALTKQVVGRYTEALTEVTLKNGDRMHYWGSKGFERYDRIYRIDGRLETYTGPAGGEYMTEVFEPGSKTVLYANGGRAAPKALEINNWSKQVHIYKRDGEGAATSSLLRKVQGGKFFARKSEEDEWEEVEVTDAWLEERSQARKEEKSKRAREEGERKRRREKEAERDRAKANAEAQFGGRTLCVGSVEGSDKATIGEDYCDTGNSM